MILKKADVPMCPECGAEMTRGTGRIISFRCDNCKMFFDVPDWGVYVPDVEAVAREMDYAVFYKWAGTGHGEQVIDWARRLRGEKS